METSERTSIILAAVAAAGPAGEDLAAWQSQVTSAARRITAFCSDRSPLSQAIDQVANSKVFAATIIGITKEASSTRGLVSLKTRVSQFSPDGIEQARTDRTDNPEGLAMARTLRGLIGHRVRVWVEVEEFANGTGKVRVVRHVEDLGEDPAVNTDTES